MVRVLGVKPVVTAAGTREDSRNRPARMCIKAVSTSGEDCCKN
jgi:hypothetical protein